jgi:hypothetical protein
MGGTGEVKIWKKQLGKEGSHQANLRGQAHPTAKKGVTKEKLVEMPK